jgi:hypothetical protein
MADQLTAAREEAAVAAGKARLAAEHAHKLEAGYARLAAQATAQGWPADDVGRRPQPAPRQAQPSRDPHGNANWHRPGPIPAQASTIRGM